MLSLVVLLSYCCVLVGFCTTSEVEYPTHRSKVAAAGTLLFKPIYPKNFELPTQAGIISGRKALRTNFASLPYMGI